MERTYNVSEAAEKIGVSVKTLQRWDREGKLVANRTLSNRRFYTEKQLKEVHKKEEVSMYIYYQDKFELYSEEEVKNFIKGKQAIAVDDKIFSMEIINDIEPAYTSAKELISCMYEGCSIILSENEEINLNYEDILKFLDKIWTNETDRDIYYAKDPEMEITEIINSCTIMAINKRKNKIKEDFERVIENLKSGKLNWND